MSTPPMTDLSPETVGRLVTLVRGLAEGHHGSWTWATERIDEARAIVAELPEPVDPDLVEAREIAADACEALGHSWVLPIRNGEKDDDARSGVGLALAAIKRGRALAGGDRS